MVIQNFNFVGIAGVPAKTNSPLIVDPDAVLALPITVELLEAIARRNPQIIE
jgi:hypothetical protein